MKFAARFLLPSLAFGLGFFLFAKQATPRSNRIAAAIRSHETGGLAGLRAFLRNGDLETVRAKLSQLAESDPLEFFRMLERLPPIPGLDERIVAAAARLPRNSDPSMDALNQVRGRELKIEAWQAYLQSAVGMAADRDIVEVASHAISLSHVVLGPFLADAVPDRPVEIFDLLGEFRIPRDGFFELLIQARPDTFDFLLEKIEVGSPNRASDLFEAGRIRTRNAGSFEDLAAGLRAYRECGLLSTEGISGGMWSALEKATPGERADLYAGLAGQAALVRNRALREVGSVASIPPGEIGHILALVTSAPIRQEILVQWMSRQASAEITGAEWLASLPDGELRETAAGLIAERAGKGK